jgi:hypothetical protein
VKLTIIETTPAMGQVDALRSRTGFGQNGSPGELNRFEVQMQRLELCFGQELQQLVGRARHCLHSFSCRRRELEQSRVSHVTACRISARA